MTMVARLAIVALFLSAMPALAAPTATYVVVINGVTIVNQTGPSTDVSRSGNGYSAELHSLGSAAYAGASATISGTASGQAKVEIDTGAFLFTLRRPASRPDLANGRFVMYLQLDGNLSGNATIDAAAKVDVTTLPTTSTSSAQRSLANQPGGDSLQFEVPVELPSNFPTDGSIRVEPTLVLKASATITGGTFQTATADAYRTLKAVGFRVFNSSGAQVTGFSMSGSRAIPELAPVPPGGRAVEFYNAGFRHYFITANPAEIASLDSGATPGWARTGESFNVFATGATDLVGVCRFFGLFGAKSSHFYAPMGLGCEALLPSNPTWSYEGVVFYTALPDADGGCPAGQVPVYRLYNNGQGGAPNHRFTTNQTVQAEMIANGYVAEGRGTGVGMCSPL
jgi:hypothetical protein